MSFLSAERRRAIQKRIEGHDGAYAMWLRKYEELVQKLEEENARLREGMKDSEAHDGGD